MTQDQRDWGSTVERVYCALTLCKLWHWLGGKYAPGERGERIYAAAQMAWFLAHNNRVYWWILKREGM